MTLAALSPLFIWWPLAFAVLALIVTVAYRLAPEPAEWSPPSPWPPPRQLRRIPTAINRGGFNDNATVVVHAFTPPTVRADPWGPPDVWTRVA